LINRRVNSGEPGETGTGGRTKQIEKSASFLFEVSCSQRRRCQVDKVARWVRRRLPPLVLFVCWGIQISTLRSFVSLIGHYLRAVVSPGGGKSTKWRAGCGGVCLLWSCLFVRESKYLHWLFVRALPPCCRVARRWQVDKVASWVRGRLRHALDRRELDLRPSS